MTAGATLMNVPGRGRPRNRSFVVRETPQEVGEVEAREGSASISSGEPRDENLEQVAAFGRHGKDGPSGIWLLARDGMAIFHPVAVCKTQPKEQERAPVGADGEDEDQATLDAACWLMPLLPRELIAEFLQLGPYRSEAT